MDIFAFGNSIFEGMKSYVEKQMLSTYPNLRIKESVIEKQFPLIIFRQPRISPISETTRNEIIKNSHEFEITVYAKNENINGKLKEANEIIKDLVNVIMYYLQNICRFKRINLQTDLDNFDNSNIKSKRAVIRFNVKCLQRNYNIL